MAGRGDYTHRAIVEAPGQPIPDGSGGFTEQWDPLSPSIWWCLIEPATAQQMERMISRTVEAMATHVLTGDFHPQLTTACRILVPIGDGTTNTRRFDIAAVQQVRGERRTMQVVCVEYLSDRDPRPRRLPPAGPVVEDLPTPFVLGGDRE